MVSNPQREVLLYYMNGGSLTVQECIRRFHTTELRRINSRLKKEGHNIKSEWENENGSSFKKYSLDMSLQTELSL